MAQPRGGAREGAEDVASASSPWGPEKEMRGVRPLWKQEKQGRVGRRGASSTGAQCAPLIASRDFIAASLLGIGGFVVVYGVA